MSVRTDVINLNVNVNGNKAQAEMNNLRKKAADIKFEMDGLTKGTKAYIDKKAELRQVTDEMDKLKKQIGLTALTQKELIKELSTLKALKGSVQPFTDEYNKLEKQIKAVESRLYDVKNGVQGFSSFFSKIKDEIKQFGVMAAGYLGFQFITSQFQSIISGSGKLSDSLADIRRVTGMTAEEVNHLNEEFKTLDTRTSGEGLRNIAIIAGKLGVAKDDIFEFTAAVDKLVVALGDELGDADQITTQLGKILNVFDQEGKVTGDNLLHAGNALVDLANKGVASGAFIVDFTQRLAGLAKTANLSLEASFGLAAGLEELGQKSESSSTAIIKVLGEIGNDVPKFAKIAGLSIEEFTKILREKPEEALIRVSEALVKGKKGFDEISSSFDAAGEDGARVVTTLSVIGGKADFMRSKISDAGSALQQTGEIQDAFALKNETFGATLDKLGKEFNKLVTSSIVTSFLQSAVGGIINFIKFLKDLPQWVNENRTVLIALTGVILTYVAAKTKATQASILNRIATMLEIGADKIEAAQKWISTAATAAYSTAKDLLTGKIKLATVAQRVWNTVIAANPLGAIVAVIAIAATAISFLTNKVKELTAAQRINAELKTKVVDATAEEVNKINILSSVIKDNSVSLDNRKKALEQLIAINPQYLSGLTLENMKTEEGKKLIDQYIASLLAKAEAEARYSMLVEKIKERNQAQADLKKKEESLPTSVAGAIGGGLLDLVGVGVYANYDEAKKKVTDLDSEIKVLQTSVTENARKNVTAALGGTNDVITQSLARTPATIKAQIEALDKAYEDIDVRNVKALRKNRDDRKKLQDELDALEGKKSPGQKKADNEYERLKKEAEKFHQDVLRLKQNAVIKGKEPEEEEIAAVQAKYEELTVKLKNYLAKNLVSKARYNEDEKLLEEAKQQELDNIFQKYFKKRVDESAQKEYEESLAASQEYFDKRKIQLANDYADNKLTKEQYDKELQRTDRDALTDRVTIAADYSKTVKKAAEDVKNFRKQKEQQITQDLIDETEKRKALSDSERLARAQRSVLTARPGSDNRLQAQKDLLQTQFDLDTQYMDKKSEMYLLKEAELQASLKDMDTQAKLEKIDNIMEYVGYFQSALTSLNQFISNRENRQLAEDKKRNDTKKKQFKHQLDDKLISQSRYDLEVQKLDEEQEKKEKEVRRAQAKREKAINLFNALVSNAAAIAKTMASIPYPANIPLAIAQGIAGGLQIAAIANTPLPELGTGDWIRRGAKHKDPEGGIPVMIERDEAVMSAAAMTDQTVYRMTGTAAQITSALNARNGGVSWSGGAVVEMPRWRRETPASINPNMARIMEQGGIVRPIDTVNTTESAETTNQLLKQIITEQQQTKEEIKTMKTKLHAVVSIKEYREQEELYDTAKKVSGIKQ